MTIFKPNKICFRFIFSFTQTGYHIKANKSSLPYYLLIALGRQMDSLFSYIYYQVNRVFANDPEDFGSIPGRVIPKTQKMVLDASLLNTQQYKVWIGANMRKE